MRVTFKGSCLKLDKVTFTTRNVANLFIVYELDSWSQDLNTVKLTKNNDLDKYSYSGYGIGFEFFFQS